LAGQGELGGCLISLLPIREKSSGYGSREELKTPATYDYYYYTAIGCSPCGSRSNTDTDEERHYIKGTI
jgi:hypothetical protein